MRPEAQRSNNSTIACPLRFCLILLSLRLDIGRWLQSVLAYQAENFHKMPTFHNIFADRIIYRSASQFIYKIYMRQCSHTNGGAPAKNDYTTCHTKIHLCPNDWVIMCGTFILSTENKSLLIRCSFCPRCNVYGSALPMHTVEGDDPIFDSMFLNAQHKLLYKRLVKITRV